MFSTINATIDTAAAMISPTAAQARACIPTTSAAARQTNAIAAAMNSA